MAKGDQTTRKNATDLYSHGLIAWFLLIISALPARIASMSHKLALVIPDLPELATQVITKLEYGHHHVTPV
jgi:hypothetical protein